MRRKSETSIIVFKVNEDLTLPNSPQILLRKGFEHQFPITPPRPLGSYCHEFAGQYDLQLVGLRFAAAGREADLLSEVRSSCIVLVYSADKLAAETSANSLKDCLIRMRRDEKFADLELGFEDGTVIKAHRFLLAARSERFRAAIAAAEASDLKKNSTQKSPSLESGSVFSVVPSAKPKPQSSESPHEGPLMVMRNPNLRTQNFPQLFSLLLDWVYCSELPAPQPPSILMDLALLADEFLLDDLRLKCEKLLTNLLDLKNVTEILLFAHQFRRIFGEELLEVAIHFFIDEFPAISKQDPTIEEKLMAAKGLVSQILAFVNSRKQKFKKVTFLAKESSSIFDN